MESDSETGFRNNLTIGTNITGNIVNDKGCRNDFGMFGKRILSVKHSDVEKEQHSGWKVWQPVEASEDKHRSFLSSNLIALDCSFLKVDLGLKAGLLLNVLMNLGYAIGFYIMCYAIRIYIRIGSTWFQKNIKSKA